MDLILPCGGRSTRFPGLRPKFLLTHPDGRLMIQKALEGIDEKRFARILIPIVREHCERYEADLIVRQAFPDPRFQILILDRFTDSAPETVCQTLQACKVDGPFVVKDVDNRCRFPWPGRRVSFMVGLSLDSGIPVSCIQNKSFILKDRRGLVRQVAEKQVCSSIIGVGVYGFSDPSKFQKAFREVRRFSAEPNSVYISHIINYLIEENLESFRCVLAKDYEDWGTSVDWFEVQRTRATYFIDVDGIIFQNCGRYGAVNWANNDAVIPENVQFVKNLIAQGAQVVFTTSRTKEFRKPLEASLRRLGLKWHAIVTDCLHSRRILINDFAPSNPYPSCEAISIPRNALLQPYFQRWRGRNE